MKTTPSIYGRDWSNIDLNSASERAATILDPYDFETLLLEISTNFKEEEITAENVRKHALNVINQNRRTAIEILEANLQNIVKHAKEERKD